MANELRTLNQDTISKLVLNGDMKGLTDAQKVEYYSYRCQQAGLDPAAKPFDLLNLNGKLILYANAACTQQLTSNRKLSHQVTNRELVDGIYCVFVRVTDSESRSTENMGAVPIDNLKGEAKANAMLKATTKAIRRAVLAHCGLGMMDETEVETIPGARVEPAKTLAQPAAEPEAVNGWTIEAQDEFSHLMDGLYECLREMPGEYEKRSETWRGRMRADHADKVLPAFQEFIGKLQAASKAKEDTPPQAA